MKVNIIIIIWNINLFYLDHGHHHHAGGRGGHHHGGGGGGGGGKNAPSGASGGVSILFIFRNKIIYFFSLNRNPEVVNKVQQVVPMVEDNNLNANNSRQLNKQIKSADDLSVSFSLHLQMLRLLVLFWFFFPKIRLLLFLFMLLYLGKNFLLIYTQTLEKKK